MIYVKKRVPLRTHAFRRKNDDYHFLISAIRIFSRLLIATLMISSLMRYLLLECILSTSYKYRVITVLFYYYIYHKARFLNQFYILGDKK